MKLFYFFSESPARASFFKKTKGSLQIPEEKNCPFLYGADTLENRGHAVQHNMPQATYRGGWSHFACIALWHVIHGLKGTGGDFLGVYRGLKKANTHDAIISTMDRVGIPLLFAQRFNLLRKPWIYVSIGLPERMQQLPKPWQRFFRAAFTKVPAVVAYGHAEAEWIKSWIAPSATRVYFIPFGVNPPVSPPVRNKAMLTDVLGVGADPQRDWNLLFSYAQNNPQRNILLILSNAAAQALGETPANVQVKCNLPLEQVEEIMLQSRVVALPVKENTYSGATTTLLQAMALACPVVVSNVGAIREGYGLENAVNVRLPEAENEQTFHQAISDLLEHPQKALEMGRAARQHVLTHLTWDQYVDRLDVILNSVCRSKCDTPNLASYED